MKVVSVSVSDLHRHADNARSKRDYTKGEVADLASSIREHGLLQPLVVTQDGDNYTILAGHRRHAALVSLGIKEAPCVVLDGDEQESLGILLGENASHRAVDPLREASAVAKLVNGFAEEKAPYERAASVLGKSVAWLRGRMRLTALSDAWRKAREESGNPVAESPIGHLELVAALPEPVQNEILEEWTAFAETGIPLLADLRASLARSTCDLSSAPWDREKAGLVDGAPACSACPFRASAQGVLFSNDSKGDRCLSAPCFEAKRRATVAFRIVEAREKHGDMLRVETTFGLEEIPVPDGVRVHREFELYARSKAKGGFPVLRLRTLEVVFMAEAVTSPATGGHKPRLNRVGPKPMAERREDLEKRRQIRAIELFRGSMLGRKVDVGTEKHPEQITPPDAQVPALLDLVGLVLAYGTGPTVGLDDTGGRLDSRSLAGLLADSRKAAAKDELPMRTRLWGRVRDPIAKALRILGPMKPESVADLAEQAAAICGVCGLDWQVAFLHPSVEAIPEPKSWAAISRPVRRRRAG